MNSKIKLFGLTALMAVSLASCGNDDAKVVKSALDVITVPNQISSYEIQLPALIQVAKGEEKVDVSVEWEATVATERFEFRKEEKTCFASVTLPDQTKNETEVKFKLVATGKYNSTTSTREFEGFLMPTSTPKPDDENIMTIAEAVNAAEGTVVTVKGITATARNGNKGFFLVDDTAAIYVYDAKSTAQGKFQYGNEVVVTATRGVNNGTYAYSGVQLVFGDDSTISVKSSTVKTIPTTAAIDLTVNDFKAWKKEKTSEYTGKLYKVTGKIAEYNPGSYKTYEIMDDNGGYISFYASDNTVYETEFAEYLADATVDGKTKKSNITVDVYLSVYDAKIDSGAVKNWRVSPLLVVAK